MKGAGRPVDRPAVKPRIFRTHQASEGWKVSEGRRSSSSRRPRFFPYPKTSTRWAAAPAGFVPPSAWKRGAAEAPSL
jgi:hypothetical protein